jgi:hypothetical protein
MVVVSLAPAAVTAQFRILICDGGRMLPVDE